MAFPKPLRKRSLPNSTPFQPCDEDAVGVVLRKEPLMQYRPLKTRDRRQSGLVTTLQACLARSVVLKACMSLTPKPNRAP